MYLFLLKPNYSGKINWRLTCQSGSVSLLLANKCEIGINRKICYLKKSGFFNQKKNEKKLWRLRNSFQHKLMVFDFSWSTAFWRYHQPKPSLKIGSVNKAFLFWCWQQTKEYLFRNKTFLFFKIESWNFPHLFDKEFCETSQNLNSI